MILLVLLLQNLQDSIGNVETQLAFIDTLQLLSYNSGEEREGQEVR